MSGQLRIFALGGIPDIASGDDLATIILSVCANEDQAMCDGDVLVIAQKIVSKAEGRLVDLSTITPSDFARAIAKRARKDPRHVEVVLRESKRIVKMDRNVLIAETRHGFVCANAGVDESNVSGGGMVSLLPIDPDKSAARIRAALAERGMDVAVIISDTFGRPWREGLVNVAIGVAGLAAIEDHRGELDATGFRLKATAIAAADELASAAALLMPKRERVPAVIIRGYRFQPAQGTARELIRAKRHDLFR